MRDHWRRVREYWALRRRVLDRLYADLYADRCTCCTVGEWGWFFKVMLAEFLARVHGVTLALQGLWILFLPKEHQEAWFVQMRAIGGQQTGLVEQLRADLTRRRVGRMWGRWVLAAVMIVATAVC
jgi:hypothetical protein